MIDYNKAQEMFEKYLETYDLQDGSIQLKIRHTYEVVKKSEYIAKELKLDKENIELAKVIALLHDIGRFEQIKLFHKFDNAKLDHAQYGVEVLFKNNLIREFVEDNQYDQIIKKSIENHNKYKIDEGMQEIEKLHCKIIRDSDKIDNFRVKEKDSLKDIFPKIYNEETANYEKISQNVYETFLKHQCIKLEDRKTLIDYWVCVIAFIFDLNFDISLQYVKDKNYINKLIDRIEYKDKETKEKMEQIRKCGNEYLILRSKK